MKTKYLPAVISAAFIVLLVSSADSIGRQGIRIAAVNPPEVSFTVKTAKDIALRWPEAPREAAGAMLDKYGAPDAMAGDFLIWQDAGEWLEITVRREEINHRFPLPHRDVLEQVVAYEVPEEKFDDLARFDGSLIAERTRGTLASRCENEAMNFLALNLAHDIVTNRKSVEEAREMQVDIARAYLSGERHPYTKGLRFHISKIEDTIDPDYSPG